MSATSIIAALAMSMCACAGRGILADIPKEKCRSILDEVNAKANHRPTSASRYKGNWMFVNGTAGGSGVLIKEVRGKISLRQLAEPEPGMRSSEQQGVIAEYVGSSDAQGLYLFLNGNPSHGSLRLRPSQNRLEGTMVDASCKGADYVLQRN
jgi:hypothetical protein